MPSRPVNLLVFREDRRRVSGNALKTALLVQLRTFGPNAALNALLRAGEVECGVADVAPELARDWELVTDQIADTALAQDSLGLDGSLLLAGQAEVPHQLEISKPEGFAYYALHPFAYADVLDQLGPLPDYVGVIGIRSIGTTLSAVTAAALRLRGMRSSRTTVRPHGHPYNRRTLFSGTQRAWLRELMARGAAFLVVDEGPGLSGSSFLSVAEALEEAGVPARSITLIGGHQPAFSALCSDDAEQRAARFRWVAVDRQARVPEAAEFFLGAGEWRRWCFRHEEDWPAAWTSLERLKYLVHRDQVGSSLYKFAGLGHYGHPVLEREQESAAAGFAIDAAPVEEGFAWYPWLSGKPMSASDLTEDVLDRMARYCAFRVSAFPADEVAIAPVEEMAQHNLGQLGSGLRPKLRLEKPVIADGRMQPHEWLLAADGRMLKADSGNHGDDHFFPGPTDIAWDLAGAIAEWRMDSFQTEFFLQVYRQASGDDAMPRIKDFTVAYSAFRAAYCLMAANAMKGSHEEQRLQRAANHYAGMISSHTGESQTPPALLEPQAV
jgi:hypothetical protein